MINWEKMAINPLDIDSKRIDRKHFMNLFKRQFITMKLVIFGSFTNLVNVVTSDWLKIRELIYGKVISQNIEVNFQFE
ncbi:MAG: hypothetical protein ACFFAU_17325 [Candidatus Hodarchaeota archaeon]